MPPSRPVMEAYSGSLEPGQPSQVRSANTHHPAGRPHTPPADWMYMTDVRQSDRQTDRHQTASLLNAPGWGHNNNQDDNYSAVIMTTRSLRVHSVHLMNAEQCQVAADPQAKSPGLGCESTCRLLLSTTTIAIYYYYSARSWHSFTIPQRVEGWVDLGTAGRVHTAHAQGCKSQWFLR